MKWLVIVVFYVISYAFGALAFPQIIGSIREIKSGNKKPYTFTLVLWLVIFVFVTALIYVYIKFFFATYLIALILPFFHTLRTQHIQ